jgi:hypothetical protein
MDATADGIPDLLLDSDGDVRVVRGPLAPGPASATPTRAPPPAA